MVLSNLPCKEKSIFSFFEEISMIPRVSGNTKPIADYLEGFAKEKGLKYYRDSADNVVIYKAASVGHESRPTLILQGHTDMVGAVAEGVDHDFSKEGVHLIVDGDFIRADGTTLGADNGSAVAYMLSLLAADDVPHPALECVFTSDEETGLFGATALDGSVLSGRTMINLDSGGEGTFIAGCAGGVRIDITPNLDWKERRENGFCITLGGFKGGHSGEDIDKGRLNAIKEISAILSRIDGVLISELTGGTADNVIATNATAKIVCEKTKEQIERAIANDVTRIKSAECGTEISICECECERALTSESTVALLCLINALPYGIQAMSREMEGLVETSDNLGVIKVTDRCDTLSISVRSSVNADKLALADKIEKIAESFGASHRRRGDYPGWRYDSNSKIRELMCRIFKESYGKDPSVMAIHAGLECGLFLGKLEGLDCISMGPDNYDIHSVKECLSISSFERTYEYIKKILKEI